MSVQYLVVVGALLHFSGTVVYLRNTLLGRTRPNRITFALWATFPLVAFFTSLTQGWAWGLVPIFMAGFGPVLIFFASFVDSRAYWKLGMLDYVCGIIGFAAIIVWVYTRDPLLSGVLAVIADGVALVPTLRKAWKFPDTETGTGYALAFLNAFFGLFAFSSAALSEKVWILYLIACNLSLVIAVYRHNPIQKIRAELAK